MVNSTGISFGKWLTLPGGQANVKEVRRGSLRLRGDLLLLFVFFVTSVWAPSAVRAEDQPLELRLQALVFADNTEFFGPFRTGETLAGSWARAFVRWPLSETSAIDIGVFGRQQFGSEKALEETRPVVAIRIGPVSNHIIFGTVEPGNAMTSLGPDEHGPHGLVPPLQVETLSLERPWEAGVQWKGTTDARTHDVWIAWQRVNTAEHRERLNAGFRFEQRRDRIIVLAQAHIVHEGGQLFGAGAVSDSVAMALGLAAKTGWRRGEATFLAAAIGSAFEPDRARGDDVVRGGGGFLRATYVRGPWRGHATYWHARDFVKAEGDANYGVLRLDGSRFRGARDYIESGLAREFRPAESIRVEASARLHVYEGRFDYSYRVLAAVDARRALGK
jgi:hypothetical protein